MLTVTHSLVDPDVTTLTSTFLDSAAALETRLHDAERRIQSLTHELRCAQYRMERAQRWFVALRRSHRRYSPTTTGKVFTYALADLAALDAKPLTPFFGWKVPTPAQLLRISTFSFRTK